MYKIQNLSLKKITTLLFLLFSLQNFGQNLHLKISGANEKETKLIDSIGYQKHQNAKSIIEESNKISERIKSLGYLENEFIENKKTNDSTFSANFHLEEKQISYIYM